mmetsp:Transcript_76339/g.223845  ORF Transcript_76339/g.223845 Transcript_76339/m.223845 type:complete len:249 (-) Transcript_76339:336-1082(-)
MPQDALQKYVFLCVLNSILRDDLPDGPLTTSGYHANLLVASHSEAHRPNGLPGRPGHLVLGRPRVRPATTVRQDRSQLRELLRVGALLRLYEIVHADPMQQRGRVLLQAVPPMEQRRRVVLLPPSDRSGTWTWQRLPQANRLSLCCLCDGGAAVGVVLFLPDADCAEVFVVALCRQWWWRTQIPGQYGGQALEWRWTGDSIRLHLQSLPSHCHTERPEAYDHASTIAEGGARRGSVTRVTGREAQGVR